MECNDRGNHVELMTRIWKFKVPPIVKFWRTQSVFSTFDPSSVPEGARWAAAVPHPPIIGWSNSPIPKCNSDCVYMTLEIFKLLPSSELRSELSRPCKHLSPTIRLLSPIGTGGLRLSDPENAIAIRISLPCIHLTPVMTGEWQGTCATANALACPSHHRFPQRTTAGTPSWDNQTSY